MCLPYQTPIENHVGNLIHFPNCSSRLFLAKKNFKINSWDQRFAPNLCHEISGKKMKCPIGTWIETTYYNELMTVKNDYWIIKQNSRSRFEL